MTKITFKQYQEMMREAGRKVWRVLDQDISNETGVTHLLQDEDMPGLTLKWDTKN